MKSRRLQLAAFAVGIAFLGYLVASTGPRRILADLARTGWTFLPIVLVWGGVYLSNTVAWLTLLRATASPAPHPAASHPAAEPDPERATIPFLRAFATTVSAFAINYVTPFAALGGEPLKGAAAARWVGARRATASVVAFRVVHTLGQFLFWAATIPVAWIVFPPDRGVRITLAIAGAVLIPASIGAVLLLRAHPLERLADVVGRPRGVVGRVLAPLTARLEPRRAALVAVDVQLAEVGRSPGILAVALAAEVGGRVLSAYEFVLVARAVGATANGAPFGFADAIAAACVSQVVMNVLFFVPFETGTREAGLLLVARLLGLPAAFGVYAAIVTRLRELTWIAIGVVLVWAGGGGRDGRKA